MYYLLQTVLL